MIFSTFSASEKRKKFRDRLSSGKLLRFPGAISPLVALEIEKLGFDGVYISGAVLSNDLGYPDIGLTTLTEVSHRGRQISRVTQLPSIIDIDTGFGEPMNVTRTVQELVELGLSGCHLEDQINPKRCGHLDNKGLVDSRDMIKKIKAAERGKTDPNFLLIARTDARASEGLEKTIDRAKAYVDAGAEMIFPEALQNEDEFEKFRKNLSVPLLANMTEFGKSRLLSYEELSNLGYNLVIYPVTTLRLAMKAIEEGLQHILKEGSQEKILDRMQHRKELYDLVRYEEYNQFDQTIYNFNINKK
jgi:methylisocitrate lyase